MGLPSVGEGFVLPDKLDASQRLNTAVHRLLREDETYLDLTNRPALYFVLDRPVPAPYPDDYNAPNGVNRRRVRTACSPGVVDVRGGRVVPRSIIAISARERRAASPAGVPPGWLHSAAITHVALRVDRAARSRCGVLRLGPPRLLRLVD